LPDEARGILSQEGLDSFLLICPSGQVSPSNSNCEIVAFTNDIDKTIVESEFDSGIGCAQAAVVH
jgi:hypothetical protein